MKKNFWIVISLGILVVVSSCKKKDEDPAPDSNEDIIAVASKQAQNDIVSWTQSDGADVVISLSDILNANSEPIGPGRMAASEDQKNAGKIYKKKAQEFRNIFVPRSSVFRVAAGDEAFVLADNAGTYSFNRADSTWTTVLGTPSDRIVINFPSDTTSSINNATLTIFGYSELEHIENPGPSADTTYLPTSINAELYIGATKYVDVVFAATYNADGNPSSMNYTLYLKPFTNTLSFTDGGSSITLTTSMAKDGESGNILSCSGTVTFFDATKDSLLTVSGYTQYRGIKLSGTINEAEIEADETFNGGPSVATLTAYADVDIIDNSNGQKVADVEWFVNADNEVDMRVRFVSDGSTKLGTTYFDPIIDELETFSTSIE